MKVRISFHFPLAIYTKLLIKFNFCKLAHNLCPIEDGGFRDPLVRLTLHPEVDGRKRESAIARGEYDPYFDQNFKFPVSRDQLQGKELLLQVMDCDRYSQNDAMGEVRINIDDIDLTNSVEVRITLHIICDGRI